MEFLFYIFLLHSIFLGPDILSYASDIGDEKAEELLQALDVERPQRFLNDPAPIRIFVSPNGTDTDNDGHSYGKPLKSIAKAVSLISKYPGRDIIVELLPGYHDLEATLNIIDTDNRTLTFRALYGKEVHVTGGKRLDSSLFKPVTDHQILSRLPAAARSHVRVADLADINITNYGSIHRYGMYYQRVAPLEIFYNGEPLRLARWPNQGFTNIVGLVDGVNGRSFKYNSQRPAGWKNEQEIWAYGFWRYSWGDRAVKVQSLNTANHTVTLAEKTTYGLTLGHWNENNSTQDVHAHQGGYFRFFNVLSELDEPGEYYMDKQNGKLYVWMPNSNGNIGHSDVVYASMINTCISIQKGSKNIYFQDITLEACRTFGIYATDVTNLTVKYMEIRNTGGYNMVVYGKSSGVQISRSFLHDGDGGIILYGGDRRTLRPSGHVIEDCEIWRFNREGAVGYPALTLDGVGTVVRYNHIHEGQHIAVTFQGNNHLFDYNHVHHVCRNTSACAAFRTSRDWTARGNRITHNHIDHVLRLVPGSDNQAVSLDAQASGTVIKYNVFWDNQIHVYIGGGRDNIVENNIMYKSTSYSILVNGQGLQHHSDKDLNNHLKMKHFCCFPSQKGSAFQGKNLLPEEQILFQKSGPHLKNCVPQRSKHTEMMAFPFLKLMENMEAVPYHSTVWTHMYPEMKNFDHQNKSLPEGNQIVKNFFYNDIGIQAIHGLSGIIDQDSLFNVTLSGWSVGPSDFYNITLRDFRFNCWAWNWAHHVNFTWPLGPWQIGQRTYYGPAYKRIANGPKPSGIGSSTCPTQAPATPPVGSYLPDGSAPNTFFNNTNQGCWLSVSKCTAAPEEVGTYRDMYGEIHHNAADNETMCVKAAVAQWQFCGGHAREQVMAIFGPTGATTIVGDGCFYAWYGCPKHGGPADGHIVPGKFSRDSWAEQHYNASHNEEACLKRALSTWEYCGSNKNHPVTSVYRPTGAKRTAGGGCWIKISKCPKHVYQQLSFYDAWAASNLHADDDMQICFYRATYYWDYCGSDPGSPVTAEYRPKGATYTVP